MLATSFLTIFVLNLQPLALYFRALGTTENFAVDVNETLTAESIALELSPS
jgi:hypothetical protein